jgi:hypothetical protein
MGAGGLHAGGKVRRGVLDGVHKCGHGTVQVGEAGYLESMMLQGTSHMQRFSQARVPAVDSDAALRRRAHGTREVGGRDRV